VIDASPISESRQVVAISGLLCSGTRAGELAVTALPYATGYA
jgi:hypothetical protein